MVAISLQQVRKYFGEVIAVNDVTLNVREGELFFLLGPSGCGKTTLLRMVAGFIRPMSGKILFDEKDITDLPPQRRDTGMVFQSYALWPHMTVAQNVGFGLDVRKIRGSQRKRKIAEALEFVAMESYAQRRPNQLSGGQQQRVALARALVFKPKCLLLDEPLSNLDAKLRGQMRSEIKRICKTTGVTTIYVTHDQKEALSMADHVAVMNEGAVAQVGPPRDIYRHPDSRFVADFLGESNFLDATVSRKENDNVLLDTPIGQLLSKANSAELQLEQTVTISMRPEAININADNGATASNQWQGRIASSTYLGELAQHQFSVGRTHLNVYERNPREEWEPGKTMSLCIDPVDVVVLTH